MKLSSRCLAFLGTVALSNSAFVPKLNLPQATVAMKGYLDDLSEELYAPEDKPDIEGDSAAANQMAKEQLDRFGPGNFNDFVDFDEFDGGDGQMGVAGDGQAGLDKSDFESPQLMQMDKSRSRSSKNAWGTSTGYAENLLEKNKDMDTSRAQQLENWHQQTEVRQKGIEMKRQAEGFDKVASSGEEDWRTLAKFGVERNTEVDLNEEFGAVIPGDQIEAVIDLHTAINSVAAFDISLTNPYMGFSDFRAAFVGTGFDWQIAPMEGTLSKTPVDFVVRFKPSNPGLQQGYLVIETEDMKQTWQIMGNTA
eukprot:CAMPEP_0197832164 /NCGR_PEP_ID=MMETSP1437-20131217/13517_1 /TAXON_ID=49252 ORGANISM="Eucampia antarctica, Strain CCMP1452" /NCGR_SAMPLE_ID=MMETSP1437 /ASSEMBLY_ACC=CAM_ASM_001096 /LENGTH=307 /DNA_ID=CAMNT_0043435377 /DNA_START=30 /DNA_END=953 /DNA_ORIENTATION=+